MAAYDVASSIAAIVEKAKTSWLRNNEVVELLDGYEVAGLSVCQQPPDRPEGGQLFLFDRRICRFFRKDGHPWRKKPDGKTIRETHEKLKVGNVETLNCYYAHADSDDGLQRRCYWQLDPEKEHTVLVHYLCCASSRATGGSAAATGQRASSGDLSGELPAAAAPRPRREAAVRGAAARRAYSPPPSNNGGAHARRSQAKLSPLATQSSLESSLASQGSDAGSLPLPLPLVQGMTLEAAAALPSLAQQYAMQQQQYAHFLMAQQQQQQEAALQQAAQQQVQAQAQAQLGQVHVQPLPAQRPAALDFDSLLSGLHAPSDDLPPRPHPGVLFTGQRMASQLASAQHAGLTSPPRPLVQQESFAAEAHRALFREMSLGIQRESVEEVAASFLLGSPTDRSLEPPALAPAGEPSGASGAGSGAGSGGEPGGDLVPPGTALAALLASPPHGPVHRRSFSRQGSGLSRLISKNWESELPMDIMLPDVDADLSAYPLDELAVDSAEQQRPASPSSRLVDHAGIAFFGSAAHNGGGMVAVQHALEPSPLGLPPLGLPPVAGRVNAIAGAQATPAASMGGGAGAGAGGDGAARYLPFSSPLELGGDRSPGAGSPLDGSAAGSLLFAAGDGGALAARSAAKERARAGMPRPGSHTHLAHLTRRSGALPDAAAAAEEQEAARRKERAEAAASAAQGHRDAQLAALRRERAAGGSDEAEELLEMIDMPENMQRLSSFLPSRGPAPMASIRGSSGAEAAAAAAVAQAELEQQARCLLKHMSIDEVDAVAAVQAAAKELEVMPTIHAAHSSDGDAGSAASQGLGLSEDLASRDPSISLASLLEGMHGGQQGAAVGVGGSPRQGQ